MLAVVFKSPMMICVVQTAKTGGGWISAMLVEMVNSTRLEDAVRQRSPQRTVPICDVGPHLRVGVGHEGLHQHRDHCLLPNQLELLQRRRVDVPELCDALQRQAKINASSQDQSKRQAKINPSEFPTRDALAASRRSSCASPFCDHHANVAHRRGAGYICMVPWRINSACGAGAHTPAKPVCGRHVVGTVVS